MNLVFLLEEPSAREMLKGSLPRVLPDAVQVRYVVFEGKHDLESWYFGDLAAVAVGLGLPNLVRYAKQKKYREPDVIHSPGNELKKISHNTYQKVSGSRAIGLNLSPDINMSHSFGVFVEGIRRVAARAA